MFKVYVSHGGKEYPLYEPLDEEVRIFAPILTEEMGSAGSFQFKIYKNHLHFDKIQPCKSEIILYQDEEAIFYGRILKPAQSFNNIVTIVCEGELTYLLDSIQEPFSFSGNIDAYIGKLLEIHNEQVDTDKRIEKGNIVVSGDNANAERTITEYAPTLTVLRTLPEEYGGYFRIRHHGGKRYLDYLWDYGGVNGQTIRFGENLLDLTKHIDASTLITCLIPQGGDVDYLDELGETKKRAIDITSVNGGKKYIKNTAAVAEYGQLWGYKKFDDITDPQRLLEKSKAYLEEASVMPESLEISAVDLYLVEESVERFRLGYWTNISSAPHGIEKRLLLSKREINLLDPTQGSIVLGRKIETFTGSINKTQAAISARVDKVAESAIEEINRAVENATSLITGGLGGYVVLDNLDPSTGKKTHPWRILIMNTPDKEAAKNILQINQNGIGFSTTGIKGPYSNAWTIDGHLVADFITVGSMLADRIRGGTLELGGTGLGRDGSIVVMDAAGNRIGSWDKNGLTILKGILQGVSAIFGGVNNQNGALEVRSASNRTIGRWDKDGIYIISGNIAVGPFEATEDGVIIGDFEVSANGSNILQSGDGTIVIHTAGGGPYGRMATICLENDAKFNGNGIEVYSVISEQINGTTILRNWDGSGSHFANVSIFDALEELREDIRNIDTGI